MAKHNRLGKQGEILAIQWLKNKGYQILATNWRYQRAEIDIVAQIKDVLVIVEVKTRSNHVFGYPEQAISKRKQQLLAMAAERFMEMHHLDNELRFDIIAITMLAHKTPDIYHIEDAFWLYD